MSTFTSKLEYKLTASGLAIITGPTRFYLSDTLEGKYIELTPGMLTNFATIPKWIQWIFPVDHEDYKMAAAFHDGLVSEFGDQIYVRNFYTVLYAPGWQESAMWFREMIKVRQSVRRGKRNKYRQPSDAAIDFITRWVFWSAVSVYGTLK